MRLVIITPWSQNGLAGISSEYNNYVIFRVKPGESWQIWVKTGVCAGKSWQIWVKAGENSLFGRFRDRRGRGLPNARVQP